MRSAALLAFATLSAGLLPLCAYGQTTFADPANLAGERISPRTGRELPIEQGALGLEQQLRKLATRASVMLIVAHPDDEDGGMLTLYSRGKGARVATLTLTRGEGGQNAVTGDFEDALGLIRTQELLAADRYFGADQMFGTEVDFGFSKTKEEAFAKWTHERVLYDAVRAVRLYRPLVLAAVFIGGVTDGHGQHQVSGEITQEVFKAAADPKVFPELTREGILPWAPLKVYGRVPSYAITSRGLFDYATNQYAEARFTNYVDGVTSATPPSPDVTVHEGETDPLLTRMAARPEDLPPERSAGDAPMSYVQFARLGLGVQKTQIGPGVRVAGPGAFDVSYHRYGSRLKTQPAVESSFFYGMDTTLTGIASLSAQPPAKLVEGLQQLRRDVDAVTQHFDAQHPDASAPALVAAQHRLGALLYALEAARFPGKADVLHELRVKQVQLNDAVVLALGLQMSARADGVQADVPQGSRVKVAVELRSASGEPVGVYAEHLRGGEVDGPEQLLAIEKETVLTRAAPVLEQLETTSRQTAEPTRPYFTRDSLEQPVYRLLAPSLRNAPATPFPVVAWATLRYHETEVQLASVVSAQGQALAVVPPASVAFPSHAQVVVPGETELHVSLKVSPPDTPITADVPSGWRFDPAPETVGVLAGARQYRVQLPPLLRPLTMQAMALPAQAAKQREGFRAVGYPGLPRTNFYTPARLTFVPVPLQLPVRRRVAYLPGTGDAVADDLRSVGVPVTEIKVADLTQERLAAFDSVILGVRTYNAHPELHGAPTQALLDFARHGGNVVVQYQTAEFTGADAPYPLALGSAEKVVDETAPLRLSRASAPGEAVLSRPNLLAASDFDGWIEERGHGFLQSWDGHYDAPTETHDPGQQPQRGGLITTALGAGHWTYCAFALYRQLPEAVPGAFRLFSNLLGLAD